MDVGNCADVASKEHAMLASYETTSELHVGLSESDPTSSTWSSYYMDNNYVGSRSNSPKIFKLIQLTELNTRLQI